MRNEEYLQEIQKIILHTVEELREIEKKHNVPAPTVFMDFMSIMQRAGAIAIAALGLQDRKEDTP